MPTLLAPRDKLFSLIGKRFTDEEFEELCFSFGIELDDITSDRSIFEKEHSTSSCIATLDALSDEILYRIEVPANRYDLLSTEGLSVALKSYINTTIPPPSFTIDDDSQYSIQVHPNACKVRPFIFCAVLKNITFDPHSYDSFIKYQDKLHQTIGRNRSLVSIGTHDLDAIKSPFTYTGMVPEDISFIPLNQANAIKGSDIFEFYQTDLKLKKFLPLLQDKPYFPLVLDSRNTVCSLPPLINGDKSKITLNTNNVFIEVTCMDAIKGEATLRSIATAFSIYCKDKLSITPVSVLYPDNDSSPFGNSRWSLSDYSPLSFELTLQEVFRNLKVDISPQKLIELLQRMLYSVKVVESSTSQDFTVNVLVPMSRTDILHKCDVIEDIAVAYGFGNFPMTLPSTNTIAASTPMNKFSDMLRIEMALSGFTEALTLTLCSIDDLVLHLNKDVSILQKIVTIGNPKSIETQALRNTLLPGLLKTLASNKAVPLPILLFEISDVVLKTPENTTQHSDNIGAKNERRLAAVFAGQTSGFEIIHSALDRIMSMLSIQRACGSSPTTGTYSLNSSKSATFIDGRYASVYFDSRNVGELGVLHPKVLENFGISHAVSFFEIALDPFV
ncbi:phenylalanine--tRNA ligase subunit beta [Mitosporidium daphniae]|uniref:phenylalanine--tRNA ligase n=1 Tax=Mitosporidium daphniae TaxID=1485682 RepID=A0A098VR58_9MICR|nr:uncharacterized protein DI09_32p130 [Mitosporidium daphniae]KGG51528.1 hypothetical protein DI09_32p130 [Mitosporidium daphniae]|eukprot:XP_013237955.1 uncharacterized protein DI09_32p130 [Mitosporidium daphniae]